VALADLYARVGRVLRRSTVYQADIPGFVADAVKTLEDQANWRHMWRESFGVTMPAQTGQISFTGRVKTVRYLRWYPVNTNPLAGQLAYASKIQPESVTKNQAYLSIAGTGFWMTRQTQSAGDLLNLDGAFAIPVNYDLGWYQYSTIDDTLPWLDIAAGVLLNQTIIEMGPLLRDEKVMQRAQAVIEAKLPPLMESDLVHQYDSDDTQMTPFFDDIEENMFVLNQGGLI
jgi:hypothetical protein